MERTKSSAPEALAFYSATRAWLKKSPTIVEGAYGAGARWA